MTQVYVPVDGIFLPELDTYVTGTGQILQGTHDPEACAGRPCVIHNQTEHAMREFPTHFRPDRYLMERICSHGVGHPDPDDLPWRMDLPEGHPHKDTGVHGCDGCCS